MCLSQQVLSAIVSMPGTSWPNSSFTIASREFFLYVQQLLDFVPD